MDVILQAADALAASSPSIAVAPKKEILKIQRRLDELNSKIELILSLVKGQQTLMMKIQKDKILETKTRSVIKLASKEISNLSNSSSRITKRTSKTSSSVASMSSSSPSFPSSVAKRKQNMEIMKSKDYYDKYPEIKKKFWGTGPGRRPLSTLKKMDQLIAKLK
jgi:hypothetical protein